MLISLVLSSVVVAIPAGVMYFAFKPLLLLRRKTKRLAAVGIKEVGTVLEIAQTGLEINEVPEMRVVLDIHPAGGARRQVTTKQLLGLGSIPRVGEIVYLLSDPLDPSLVLIAGGPAVQPKVASPAPKAEEWSDAQELDLLALTTRIREHGVRGIATVLAVHPGEGQATRFTLEIDSVVEEKRQVTVSQVVYGDTYVVGDRAYVLIDPEDRDSIALMPLSLSGGRKPDKRYRLDKLVLGPQLLREGARGQGTVLSVERIPAPVLESMGHAKVVLRMRIVPDDGGEPYEASQEQIFSSEEKLQKWGSVGCVLPVRYDWHDRMTFCGDLMSLGHPDPYAEFEKADQLRQKQYMEAHPELA